MLFAIYHVIYHIISLSKSSVILRSGLDINKLYFQQSARTNPRRPWLTQRRRRSSSRRGRPSSMLPSLLTTRPKNSHSSGRSSIRQSDTQASLTRAASPPSPSGTSSPGTTPSRLAGLPAEEVEYKLKLYFFFITLRCILYGF
jgi:hypothetical protein